MKSWLSAIGRWIVRTAEDFWSFIEFMMPALILITLLAALGFWLYARSEPSAVLVLDRSEWACTQSAKTLVYITPQGVPINQRECTQWNRQP
jgi:hypothetical protein